MKKLVNCCLTFGLFLFVFAGELPQMLQADTSTAYAMGSRSGNKQFFNNNGGSGNGYQVPEPGTLSLLGTGIAGLGIFYFVRRKNRK